MDSKICHKYRNRKCRFNFSRCFMKITIVVKPLSDGLTEHEKAEIILI